MLILACGEHEALIGCLNIKVLSAVEYVKFVEKDGIQVKLIKEILLTQIEQIKIKTELLKLSKSFQKIIDNL